MSEPIDDKAGIRDQLDLATADWERCDAGGTIEGPAEFAHIPHTDGVTYTVLRNAGQPAVFNVYTPREWDAFVKGVNDGEFDVPEEE